MESHLHKPGPLPKHYVTVHVCLEPEQRAWAKAQKEGLSGLMRRLLAQEMAEKAQNWQC
jgi:hypothetical protein